MWGREGERERSLAQGPSVSNDCLRSALCGGDACLYNGWPGCERRQKPALQRCGKIKIELGGFLFSDACLLSFCDADELPLFSPQVVGSASPSRTASSRSPVLRGNVPGKLSTWRDWCHDFCQTWNRLQLFSALLTLSRRSYLCNSFVLLDVPRSRELIVWWQVFTLGYMFRQVLGRLKGSVSNPPACFSAFWGGRKLVLTTRTTTKKFQDVSCLLWRRKVFWFDHKELAPFFHLTKNVHHTTPSEQEAKVKVCTHSRRRVRGTEKRSVVVYGMHESTRRGQYTTPRFYF